TSAVDFGAVERGSQAVRRFVLLNQTAKPLATTVSTAGAAFSSAPATIALDPQSSTTLEVLFAPTQAGPQQGEFRIDQRRFTLRGSTLEPPLPKPVITID